MDIEYCTVCHTTIMVSLYRLADVKGYKVTTRVISTASTIAQQLSSAVAICPKSVIFVDPFSIANPYINKLNQSSSLNEFMANKLE